MVLWLAPTLRRTLVTNWRNGNFLIGAGAVGIATSAAMAYDEYRRDQKAATLGEVRMALTQLGQEEKRHSQDALQKPKFSDRKPAFSATIVRRVDTVAAFDGPLALTDVVVGQAVQVLVADCGPDKGYHDVRSEFGEGLYPKAYIQPDIPRDQGLVKGSPAAVGSGHSWLSGWRRPKGKT